MHLFYTPDISGKSYQLSEEESKHCIKVLRLGIKDKVYLVDGKGGFYEAEIIDEHPKRTILLILNHQENYAKRNHYLHIAIAPTKNIDRFEWFLEKATEIGIDEITPIICERSERKELKIERSEKIITSAIKQSKKAYHPILNPAIKLNDFFKQANADYKYIAHCIESQKQMLSANFIAYSKYLILIGPEGDFTEQEVNSSLFNDFKAISLGDTRLRTETAALAACFEINYLNR